MQYSELAFPTAHIHFVDTDAAVNLPVFAYRLSLMEPLTQDTLFTASDDVSYFNAGWLAICRACVATVGALPDVQEMRRRRDENNQHLKAMAAECAADLVETDPDAQFARTSSAMSALVVAAVWRPTEWHRLRPSSVREILGIWCIFGRFGCLHWRHRNRGTSAHPLVDGSQDAVLASDWGKSAYEQLQLTWVLLLAQAASAGCVKSFGGPGEGFMTNKGYDKYPQVPAYVLGNLCDRCMTRQVATMHEWEAIVDEGSV